MTNKYNIIFIGTGLIGCPLLKALQQDDRFNVKLVITQADKPAGRKMQIQVSPIKVTSAKFNIKIFQPININSKESIEKIKALKPDMIILMAYGQILKKELLGIPKFGCINVHASLLPKYRGASPIQQAILNQDKNTGISILEMEEKMDSGPVFKTFSIPIEDDDNAITLADKLANLTANSTPNILDDICNQLVKATSQNNAIASYCQKINKSDGKINWKERANVIEEKIRAFTGWPGTFTFWNKKRLKIISAKTYNYPGEELPGIVIRKNHDIIVMTEQNAIRLIEVQLEGKNIQLVEEFIKGYTNFIGSKLG